MDRRLPDRGERKVESLQQMSEDMKVHIAQLKAELGIEDLEKNGAQCNVNENLGETATLVSSPHVTESLIPTIKEVNSNLITMDSSRSWHHSGDVKKDNFNPKRRKSAPHPVSNIMQSDSKQSSSGTSVKKSRSRSSISSNRRRTLKMKKAVVSSTDTSENSLSSNTEGTEQSIPMKYLQMSSTSNSPRVMKKGRIYERLQKHEGDPTKDLELKKLESLIREAEERCQLLAEENVKVKTKIRSKAGEKIADLKRKNIELANIARSLEEKAKSLQELSAKKSQEIATINRELQQQKKSHQRYKARCDNEYAQAVASKDSLVSNEQLEDLKKSLKQASMENLLQDDESEKKNKQQNLKEILQLQKLAAASSSKVVIRSLSTPVTARQKILEESNRNLRRQITTLEDKLQHFESNPSEKLDFEEKLKELEDENKEITRSLNTRKSQVLNLEFQLQESKIESSDAGLHLSELKQDYAKLQEEYTTVHEQLAVGLKERDKAVQECRDHLDKSEQLQSLPQKLREREEMYQTLENKHNGITDEHNSEMKKMLSSHSEVVNEYKQSLQQLQAKVIELEKHREEQDLNNINLKEQFNSLVEWSRKQHPENLKSDNQSVSSSYNNQNMNSNNKAKQKVPSLKLSTCSSTSNSKKHTSISEEHIVVKGGDDTEAEEFDEEILSVNDLRQGNDSNVTELRVYVAKYSYNPYQSLNEDPEAELPLVAGDYVYIHENIDNDDFYQGVLLNGREGLVPSNFLEKVNLSELDSSTLQQLKMHFGGTNLQENSAHREMNAKLSRSVGSDISYSFGGSSIASETTDQCKSNAPSAVPNILPYPRKLRVEKKLSHSLIIGWVAPHLGENDFVEEYHVVVNQNLSTVVNGSRSKAVVENVYGDKCYRISVCAVTEYGRSDVNHCVITYGDAEAQISNIGVRFVGSNIAMVVWDPVDSNCTHSISVGEVTPEFVHSRSLPQYQRQILVGAPMCEYSISNLKQGCCYEVVVKSKNHLLDTEVFSPVLRFETLQNSLPEPPVDVEIIKNSESIFIHWLPVTISEKGKSNGLSVLGYQVNLNEYQLEVVKPCTSNQFKISFDTLSKHIQALVDDSADHQHHISNDSAYMHYLPSLKISLKTVSVEGSLSESSNACYLHMPILLKLLREYYSSKTSLTRLRPRSGSSQEKSRPSSNKHSDINSSLIPAIEITHESSSEEEIINGSRKKRFHKSVDNTPVTVRRGNQSPANHDAHSNGQGGIFCKSVDNFVTYFDGDTKKVAAKGKIPTPSYKNAVVVNQDRNLTDEESLESHSSISTSGSFNSKDQQNKPYPHGLMVKDGRFSGKLPKSSKKKSYSSQSDDCNDSGKHNVQPVNAQHSGHRNTISSQSGVDSISELEIPDECRISLFVALYDYNPYIMSPNTECLQDELSFNEGQLIKVYGEKDNDGFYLGEKQNGNKGYVPCNMVLEIQVSDREMLEELFEHGVLPPGSPEFSQLTTQDQIPFVTEPAPGSSPSIPEEGLDGSTNGCLFPSVYVALFDYDPKQSSPNADAEAELSFKKGERINVYGSMDEDGFYKGEKDGHFGLVPSNFLEELSKDSNSMVKKATLVSATTMTDQSIMTSSDPDHSFHSNKSFKSDDPTVNNNVILSGHKHAEVKKKGIFSKGKKLLRKIGGNDTRGKK